MDSVLFTGLDETKNFPLEVRKQLSESNELNSTIKPMTKSERDNLKSEDRWPGRAIYNLNQKAIEIWHEDLNQWVLSLDQEYTPPPPKPPWDDSYILPEIVRYRLSEHEEFKNKTVPLTQASIDALTPDELWAGRVVYNITTKQHILWFVNPWGFGSWVEILNDTYVPPRESNSWLDWSPIPRYENNTNIPFINWQSTVHAGYLNQHNRVSLYARFYLTNGIVPNVSNDPLSLAETGMLIKCSLPVLNATPEGIIHIGNCNLSWWSISQSKVIRSQGITTVSGGSQHMYFHYLKGSGDISEPVADNKPDYQNLLFEITATYETSS